MAAIAHYGALIDRLNALPRRQRTLLVGIDGCGGAGKSTVAAAIRKHTADVAVVPVDDFAFPNVLRQRIDAIASGPIGGDFDWHRLTIQLIDPLTADRPGRYQRYDWATDTPAEMRTVPASGIIVIEGCYAMLLAERFDYTIWVECPPDVRLARSLARDGEAARAWWEQNWMPKEDRYVSEQRPADRADLIIDGRGFLGEQPYDHFVGLGGNRWP